MKWCHRHKFTSLNLLLFLAKITHYFLPSSGIRSSRGVQIDFLRILTTVARNSVETPIADVQPSGARWCEEAGGGGASRAAAPTEEGPDYAGAGPRKETREEQAAREGTAAGAKTARALAIAAACGGIKLF